MPRKIFYVYVLSSLSRSLYVGVTSDLRRRVIEHRRRRPGAFTTRYNITRLVHYEAFGHPMTAIKRERQIKSWTREKRLRLSEEHNAGWFDLAADW